MARQPNTPQNLEAERALLGAIFLHNDTLFDVSGIVVKGDFFEPANGEIFSILKDHIEAGRTATPVTILHDMSQDADIGGIAASAYLNKLFSEGVPREVAIDLAKGIRDTSIRRRIIAAAEEMANEARHAPVSVRAEDIRDKYDTAFAGLFATTEDIGVQPISHFSEALIDKIQTAMQAERSIGLEVGLKCVRDLTGPLLPGLVYVAGGPPGSGKSALAQQLAEYQAERLGAHVFFASAEMPGVQVAGRALAARSDIAAGRMARATLDDAESDKLMEAHDKLKAMPLFIDQRKNPSVASIRAKALRLKRLKGLDAVYIDHLLYLSPPSRGMSAVEAIMPNMQEIKGMADALAVPVIVLAQLKGSFPGPNVRRPKVDDLWNTSAVEQNADVIIFAHRPEHLLGQREPDKGDEKARSEWEIEIDKWKGRAEIILAKNRDDRGQGVASCFFRKRTMRFSDNDTFEDRPPAQSFLEVMGS